MTTSKVDHRQGLTTYTVEQAERAVIHRMTYITSTHTVAKVLYYWHNDTPSMLESFTNHANGRTREREAYTSQTWADAAVRTWSREALASEIEWMGNLEPGRWALDVETLYHQES